MVYDIKIIPLNEFYLKQTIKLVKSIFKYEKESVSLELKASVDNDEFNKYLLYEDNNIRTLEYFIAINNKGKILGVVGLYSLNDDYIDTYWLGWFCVAKDERGKGIGKILLEYVINEARVRQRKYLKLYTSTYKDEAAAEKLYDKYDFFITAIFKGKYEKILYRKKYCKRSCVNS